jgi:hypothetical protein
MNSQGYMHFKQPLTAREQAIMEENLGYIVNIDDWWMGLSLISQPKDNTLQTSTGESSKSATKSQRKG